MTNVLIIVGHASRGSFCEALGEAYRKGAEKGGHRASLFVISAMTFDPVLHDGYRTVQPLEPDLKAAREALSAAGHIVIIFPLWFGKKPAILSNFSNGCCSPNSSSRRGPTAM